MTRLTENACNDRFELQLIEDGQVVKTLTFDRVSEQSREMARLAASSFISDDYASTADIFLEDDDNEPQDRTS